MRNIKIISTNEDSGKGCREKYLLTDGTTGKAGGTQSMEGFGCQAWKFIQRETSFEPEYIYMSKVVFKQNDKDWKGWLESGK